MARQTQQKARRREPGGKAQSEFDSKLVDLSRVTRVSAGGRRFRFRAVVVTGDKKSRVGVGVAKGADVAQAVQKATHKATKHLVTVPMQNDTIPNEVQARFGASHILLKPQQRGRGLVAGGVTRIIAEMAGLKNVSAKTVSRSRNKLNNALATLKALRSLKSEARSTKSETIQNDQNPKSQSDV